MADCSALTARRGAGFGPIRVMRLMTAPRWASARSCRAPSPVPDAARPPLFPGVKACDLQVVELARVVSGDADDARDRGAVATERRAVVTKPLVIDDGVV